ncbi:ribonuclease III [Balneolaceae bacterium ANBcel3]|nr:ribonuclease III [Balneolaceae bacterium ANBcel3]
MFRRIRSIWSRRKLSPDYKKKVSDIEVLTGIPVLRPELYLKALRHRSIVTEKNMDPTESYEQLEFIGDAILDLVTSEIIFERFPSKSEGFMTQLRSRLVKGQMLAEIAKNIGIPSFIELGDRVKNQGVEHTESVLADTFEALVGAIFEDHGYYTARTYVMKLYQTWIDFDELISTQDNYKSMLLEAVQSLKKPAPIYRVISESGPGHDKMFEVEVVVNQLPFGQGRGKNKKKAEQEAAKNALNRLNEI